jgi:thiol-disulfide isomerase/thioredoxin
MNKYIKEFLIFSLVLIIATNIISYYRGFDLNKVTLNKNIELVLKENGYKLSTKKPTMIHFWATWCPVCGAEASNIEYISKNYNVITIAVKSPKDEIDKYLKSKNLTFKVIEDNDGNLARLFNISVFPTTLIYDKNKKLSFSEVGYTTTLGLLFRMLWID